MVYLIRKSPGPFAAVAEGRENTLLLGKNECVRIDEEIHFVEFEHGRRTGKECYGRVEYIYDKIYDRDGGHCIWCGVPIEYGVKYHHEPCGIYRSDEETKVVMLCPHCHFIRHHQAPAVARDICVDYLHRLYGEKGALKE